MDCIDTVPIQYREGRTRFMDMDILVAPRVFIPRPETELLIRTVADLCQKELLEAPFILDIGTGSGVVPLGLTRFIEGCRVISVDISQNALEVAEQNIARYGRGERITLMRSDMFEVFGAEHEGLFDAVVSNPPYVSDRDYEELDPWVKAEPRVALYAGKEGLDHLSVLVEESPRFLKPDGFVAVEVGYDQGRKVKDLFMKNGFSRVKGLYDFNNYERVIVGWKNG